MRWYTVSLKLFLHLHLACSSCYVKSTVRFASLPVAPAMAARKRYTNQPVQTLKIRIQLLRQLAATSNVTFHIVFRYISASRSFLRVTTVWVWNTVFTKERDFGAQKYIDQSVFAGVCYTGIHHPLSFSMLQKNVFHV